MTLEDVGWEPYVTCRPSDTVALAKEQMDKHGVEGVIVVHPGGIPMASFGRERLQSPPLPKGIPWDELMVGPYAKRSRIVFTPQTKVKDAVRVMHRRDLTLAPVRQGGKVAGMVSRRRLETDRKQGVKAQEH